MILLCFVSLILADNPLDILKDEFTIIRPFTVLENNATFYCKVTILVIRRSSGSRQAVVRQSPGNRQAVNGQSSGSQWAVNGQLSGPYHIFSLEDLNLSHLQI